MTASPAANSADGAARRRAWPRASRVATAHATGSAASSARRARTRIVPVIANVATAVPAVPGADHCQPMTSWDQMAPPTPRKTAAQQASEASPAWACTRASSGAWGAQPHSPASVSRATRPPLITSAVRAADLAVDLGRSANSAISSSVNSSP